METTERIVEAYCRHIRGWFTLPNVRVGNTEVDLIAQSNLGTCYHIEVHVSVSSAFSKLTADPYVMNEERIRGRAAGARNKIGFYVEKKFSGPSVVALFTDRGIDHSKVQKVVVAWDAEPEALIEARNHSIEVWLMPDLMLDLMASVKGSKAYHGDDTMRTIQMVERTIELQAKKEVVRQRQGRPNLQIV